MSEKPFTELFKKSGLFEKYLPEFQRWRLVNEDDTEAKKPEQTLDELVEEIGKLLEQENVMQQTRFAPLPTQAPKQWIGLNTPTEFWAIRDEMGNLVTEPLALIERGDRYYTPGDRDWVSVEDVDTLYEGDKVVAKLIKLAK